MICSTSEKNQASYSSDILRVPKESDFRAAEKGVTIWVCVTIRGVTIRRLYDKYCLNLKLLAKSKFSLRYHLFILKSTFLLKFFVVTWQIHFHE